jgi:hypothetical protein
MNYSTSEKEMLAIIQEMLRAFMTTKELNAR